MTRRVTNAGADYRSGSRKSMDMMFVEDKWPENDMVEIISGDFRFFLMVWWKVIAESNKQKNTFDILIFKCVFFFYSFIYTKTWHYYLFEIFFVCFFLFICL